MERTYMVKRLDCAHCGSKIEKAIGSLEGIESAVLTFPTRQLRIKGKITSSTLSEMNLTAQRIEPDVEIVQTVSSDEEDGEDHARELVTLIAGVLFFAAALILERAGMSRTVYAAIFGVSYIFLGGVILAKAVKNIGTGNFFDENLLMTAAAAGAFIIGEYAEAVGVVLFFRIGELFEDYAVSRSKKSITAASELRSEETDIFRDGTFVRVSSDEIKVGDIMRIRAGECIAADGIVESGASRIDMSAVNGEPVPVSVNAGDSVVSGCINRESVITVRATAAAADSMAEKIARSVIDASAEKPSVDRFITRFARIYTPFVLIAAFLTAVIPSIVTGEWQKWIYSALTFLVISCPCALVLSVPLAYFSAVGAASHLGILFRGGRSVEALSQIKAAAFDKTGTLTNGTFNVTGVYPENGFSERELLEMCSSCEQASTHPAALSIMRYCEENGIVSSPAENIRELSGRGISGEYCGKRILCGNDRLMRENGITCCETGVSGTVVHVAADGIYAGAAVVSDTIRETSAEAVSSLKKMGIKTVMLTGDKPENAESAAKILGVDSAAGGLLPDDKLNEVRKLRRSEGAVMFIGDGINDAPVLAGADVGGAMHSGSDLAVGAADVVFMNSDVRSVVRAKKIADRTRRTAYQNIGFALAVKLAVLVLGILGHPSMWFAVFADSGTAVLLILNSIRLLDTKRYK